LQQRQRQNPSLGLWTNYRPEGVTYSTSWSSLQEAKKTIGFRKKGGLSIADFLDDIHPEG
jgi:hypothetical protein